MSLGSTSSRFFEVPMAPPIRVFNLSQQCSEDPNLNKVNLTVGGDERTHSRTSMWRHRLPVTVADKS